MDQLLPREAAMASSTARAPALSMNSTLDRSRYTGVLAALTARRRRRNVSAVERSSSPVTAKRAQPRRVLC